MAAIRGSFQSYKYRGVTFYVWIDAKTFEYCLDTRDIKAIYPKATPVSACRFPSHAAAFLAGKKMIERAFQEVWQARWRAERDDDSETELERKALQQLQTEQEVLLSLLNVKSFTQDDIRALTRSLDPDVLIRKWLSKNVIVRVQRGVYAVTPESRTELQRTSAAESLANPLSGYEKHVLVGAGIASALLILLGLRKELGSPLTSGFGKKVAADAKRDLGVAEGSSRVSQMLANYGINFPVNWCAVAVGTWIKESAAQAGITPPIAGSASAKSTMLEFQDASNKSVGWLDADALRADPRLVAPGMIVIWQRGPTASWMGHIGVVTSGGAGGKFTSIEGNAGAGAGAVVESTHDLSAGSLLGMGYFVDSALAAQRSVGVAGVGMLGALPKYGIALMPTTNVLIRTNSGLVIVKADVADTNYSRAYGLMNCRVLAENSGMWFVFDDVRNHPFYMKNTYIPLDIVFVGQDNRVVGILENMQPLSTALRSVNVPSKYALEVNAGFVRAYGIQIGQHVTTGVSSGVGYYADPANIETFAPPGA